MGRKTYESIGKPLPGRTNIIITNQSHYQAPGCIITNSLEEALSKADHGEECMVIGGADIFKLAMPLASRLYITQIHEDITGDRFFPDWQGHEWRESNREDHEPDPKHLHSYSFITLDRITQP